MSKKTIHFDTFDGRAVSVTFDPKSPAVDVHDTILEALRPFRLDEPEEDELATYHTLANLE